MRAAEDVACSVLGEAAPSAAAEPPAVTPVPVVEEVLEFETEEVAISIDNKY
jgi:hypothetical protein